MLQAGQPAPAFALPDADMESFDLSELRGKNHAVLYFYPKDDTPGCTIEAIDFTDHEDEFARHGCVILGVSRDDLMAHFLSNHVAVAYGDVFGELVALSQELGFKLRILTSNQ